MRPRSRSGHRHDGARPTTGRAPRRRRHAAPTVDHERRRAGRADRADPPSRCTGGSRVGARLRDGHRLYWWGELLAVVGLLLRLLVRPEPEPRQPATRRSSTRSTSSGCRSRSASTTSRRSRPGRSARAPFIIACNYFYGSLHFIVTGGVMIYLYRRWTNDYPRWRNTLAITTALALIGFAFFPLLPPRLLDARDLRASSARLRLRRHAGEGPRVLVVQLGRGEQDLEPVRGDAERALRLGAVVRVRARPPAQARVGQGARRALPGHHGHGDRRHRQPLLPRRGRRVPRARHRLRRGPDLHPRRTAARRPSRQPECRQSESSVVPRRR